MSAEEPACRKAVAAGNAFALQRNFAEKCFDLDDVGVARDPSSPAQQGGRVGGKNDVILEHRAMAVAARRYDGPASPVAQQARKFDAGHPPGRPLRQIGSFQHVDRGDAFELDTDAGELGRYMGEAVPGSVQIDDQALHADRFALAKLALPLPRRPYLGADFQLCSLRNAGKSKLALDLPVTGRTTSAASSIVSRH